MTLLDGLILATPSSVSYTGTSATINANGAVDFSGITGLTLNGVFTSTYDNYRIVMSSKASSGNNIAVWARVASGGTTDGSNNYYTEVIDIGGTTLGSRKDTSTVWTLFGASHTELNGITAHMYKPAIAAPTSFRLVHTSSYLGATINESAGVHNVSTSYDGFAIYPAGGPTLSGTIAIYGYNQ